MFIIIIVTSKHIREHDFVYEFVMVELQVAWRAQ